MGCWGTATGSSTGRETSVDRESKADDPPVVRRLPTNARMNAKTSAKTNALIRNINT